MFGKTKDDTTDKDHKPAPTLAQQYHRPAMAQPAAETADKTSTISSDMTIVGKIAGDGTVKVFGRIEGELRATTILISDGAHVEGEIAAEDVTIGGSVKGTVHANRVKLNSTAIVEGDIFHRSLAIEENARFEGSSRREDNAVATPRLPLSRPAAQAAAVGSTGKPNGAPGGEAHAATRTD